MEINEMLKKYVEIQKQEESLKTKKESLKASIIEFMQSHSDSYVSPDKIKCEYFMTERIKYTDEAAIIKELNDKYGYNNMYVETKINSKLFNKHLKDNEQLLTESISKNITKTLTETIRVTTVKGE